MSFLQGQKSFAASAAAASKNFAKKTSVTPSSSQQSLKKRTPEPSSSAALPKKQPTAYSQPQDTGKGSSIQTQVVYAFNYIKEKLGRELSLDQILSYLSETDAEQPYKDAMAAILQRHPQVAYDRKNETYKFRPKHDVTDADGLLAKMQSMATFRGLDVKELKEGWREADHAIDELEKEHKIVVLRNKKDQTPRFVYPDDPSMYFKIDSEFQDLWHKIKIPADGPQLIDEVIKEGQTPTNKQGNTIKKMAAKVEKPKRKARRGGRITNKHMQGIFKNFDHLRR